MKQILGLLLLAAPLAAQHISVGVKGGVPFTEAFKTSGGPTFNYRSLRNPYTVGPSLEVRLPQRFSVSLDVLYKRLGFAATAQQGELNMRANQWEFPVMVKYRFKDGLWSPYVAAGPSFNKITSVSRTITNPSQFVAPDEFKNSSSGGFAFGCGLEFKPVVRITTELRWTRRGTKNFFSAATGLLESNLNQAEFLVGIHF
ncbi:MAG: PorT family protein [Bryobacterales bacterium]|nr:PorT family protein [Bryobacterales bacterium]